MDVKGVNSEAESRVVTETGVGYYITYAESGNELFNSSEWNLIQLPFRVDALVDTRRVHAFTEHSSRFERVSFIS